MTRVSELAAPRSPVSVIGAAGKPRAVYIGIGAVVLIVIVLLLLF
jgi:hypothetical protein